MKIKHKLKIRKNKEIKFINEKLNRKIEFWIKIGDDVLIRKGGEIRKIEKYKM